MPTEPSVVTAVEPGCTCCQKLSVALYGVLCALGGSKDLDELHGQIMDSGGRPSDFAKQQISLFRCRSCNLDCYQFEIDTVSIFDSLFMWGTEMLKLYVFKHFCPDHSDGLAFAIAESVEDAKEQIRKDRKIDPYDWGEMTEHPLDEKFAASVSGGG